MSCRMYAGEYFNVQSFRSKLNLKVFDAKLQASVFLVNTIDLDEWIPFENFKDSGAYSSNQFFSVGSVSWRRLGAISQILLYKSR